MRPITGHARIRSTGARLAALLTAVVALGACSSAAAPGQSASAAPPTGTPVANAAVSPSPTTAPTPSATAEIAKVSPIPGAPDSGTVLRIVAVHVKWDRNALAAPAGKIWHVEIDNQDDLILNVKVDHNFTVASGPTFPERIFQSPKMVTGKYTFDIPALPAGDYLFICTIHAYTMTGTLTIK